MKKKKFKNEKKNKIRRVLNCCYGCELEHFRFILLF